MNATLKLSELLAHPPTVLDATGLLLAHQLITLDCSGVQVLREEQLTALFGHMILPGSCPLLDQVLDLGTISSTLAPYILSWMFRHGFSQPSLSPLGQFVESATDRPPEQSPSYTTYGSLTLFELAPIGIVITSLDGQFLQVNPAFCKMLGYPLETLLGLTWQAITDPEDQAQNQAVARALIQGDRPCYRFEKRYRTQHNTDIEALVEVLLIRDAAGQPLHFLTYVVDISDRKSYEEALYQSQTLIINILNSIPDPIFVKDEQHRWIMLNDAFCKLIGHSKEALIGKTDYDFLPPEQADVFWHYDQVVLETGEESTNEEIITDAQGDRRTLATKKSKLILPNQKPAIVGVIRDITSRKQKEARLRLLESAVTHANDVIIITEAEPITRPGPRIVYVNPAFTLETGYTLDEVIGRNPRFLQGPNTDRQQLDKIRTALANWKPVQVELMNYRKDRSEYWVELSLVPIADETGWYTHWMAVQRNITARKQAEAGILNALAREKELNELKTRFVSMVSHEFRTPLTTIQSAADILQNLSPTEEEQVEMFQQIHCAVSHMVQLLEDVLFIGRAETTQIQVHITCFDIVQFCHMLVAEMQHGVGQFHQIVFHCDRLEQSVCLDRKLMRQILTNLITNAVKYSPPHSTIWIGLKCQTEHLIFDIQDQGIGIPQPDQENLFEFFYRATNVGTISGTGLGLAIVKTCVNLQGGSITVSSAVNQGTRFTVTLPIISKGLEL